MARKKTKKQKVKATNRKPISKVSVSETGVVSVEAVTSRKTKIKSTTEPQSQVNLVYKDLLKTGLTTLVVFIVLLSIFIYVR